MVTGDDGMDLLAHCGPWTIDVCEDCGRTRQDMSHGKCSTPTRWRKVEVAPVNQPPGAVEDRETLREAILHVLTLGDVGKQSRGRLRAVLNSTYRGR